MKIKLTSLILLIGLQIFGQGIDITGITVVASSKPINDTIIQRLDDTNAEWLAFVPYGFMREDSSRVMYNGNRQWWGERVDGISKCITLAHQQGKKVMLKPQIWMRGQWVGHIDFDTEEEWLIWEESYRDYIMIFLDLAIKQNVELFCLGTEYEIATTKREQFWRDLIKEIRSKYDGLITYSSNWDNYRDVPFWEELDFIGISAYFPLSNQKKPNVKTLMRKWKSVCKNLKSISVLTGKKVLFTEYGYLTVAKCASKTWILEKKLRELTPDEEAQANAFQALYQSLYDKDYWAGGFIWKWFPHESRREGGHIKDYTPKDKMAERTIAYWYGKEKN